MGKIKKQADMIKNSFLKCRLSNNLDGFEDDQIKIRRVENYIMPSAEREFLLKDDKSGSQSEFTEVDTGYFNDLTKSGSELESD